MISSYLDLLTEIAIPATAENAIQTERVGDRKISVNYSFSDNGVIGLVSIDEWLRFCASDTVREECTRIRSIEDKDERSKEKRRFPICTPSVSLTTRDKAIPLKDRVLTYSGVVCLDYDLHDVQEAEMLVEALRRIPYIYFAGVSFSGRGVYAFAVTDNGDYSRHGLYWAAISDDVEERTGYANDEQTKDVTRTRVLAYNSGPVTNESVIPFSLPEGYEGIDNTPTTIPREYAQIEVSSGTIADVEECIQQWEKAGVILGDSTYGIRYKLGMALANLGDAGLPFYIRICAGYTHHRTPEQEYSGFVHSVKSAGYTKVRIGIGTFFWVLRERYGITLKEKDLHLSTHGLTDPFADTVEEVARVYQCPVEFSLVSLFVAVGTVIGKKVSLWDGKHINYPQLWVAIVAPAGKGKSQPLDFFFTPIMDLDGRRHKEYRQEVEEWVKNEKQGPRPICRRLTIDDSTPEKRDEMLSENPRGLCLKVDELKTLLDNVNRYTQSGEVSRFLSIFNNVSYTVDRKMAGSYRVDRPCMSIIGTIQPAMLVQTFGRKELRGNGFLPRWLFVWNAQYPTPKYVDESISDSVIRLWQGVVEHYDTYDEEMQLTLSPDAKQLYIAYFDSLQEKAEKAGEDSFKCEVYAKLQINVLRWALITQIIVGVDESHEVDAESMQYAIECMEYFEQTAFRVGKRLQGASINPEEMSKKNLIKALAMKYPGLSPSLLAKALGTTVQNISNMLRSV